METLRDEELTRGLLEPTPESLAAVLVFPLIPNLRRDVWTTIDSALSWEQLTASDINFAIVRPLVFKYAKLDNLSVVYACFVVRSHFLSEAANNLAYSGVNLSRANLCEIMAIKLLNNFAANRLALVCALTASWSPLAGAPPQVVNEVQDIVGDDGVHDPQCALEMAIGTESKMFLASPIVQKLVNDIYTGRIVFSMKSHRSVLADNYKPRSIEIYDVSKAPFLDHYRLRVPKYGAILEFCNFGVLLFLFLLCLSSKDLAKVTPFEVMFIVFATAFALEEYTASKEHGWGIYIANIWNVFDTSFVIIFLTYLGFRIKGLSHNDLASSDMAFDILACGACILFPRLAFFAVSTNVVVLALRAMIADFVFFIGVAAICFSGLLFTLHSLADGRWSLKAIAWLMVQIWFGNTYLSFAQATSFHKVFGPILMTCFAALSNTLLLTILISILSNTFARIDANANREYLFQFAIGTIEGVKSDALFSYQPPFNLLAFLILYPLSFVLTPRSLHSTNVFLIKVTSFPILVLIGIYERYLRQGQKLRDQGSDAAHNIYSRFSRQMKHMPILEHIVGSTSANVYEAIFETDMSTGFNLFEDTDDEANGGDIINGGRGRDRDRECDVFGPRSRRASRESLRAPSITVVGPSGSEPRASSRPQSVSRTPQTPTSHTRVRRDVTASGGGISPNASPRPRRVALPQVQLANLGEIPAVTPRSPLTSLFMGRVREHTSSQVDKAAAVTATAEAGIRRIEALAEDIKRLPVNKLKDEMKELQDRQARIENLLLMLTRGMRNELGHHSTIRHDTM